MFDIQMVVVWRRKHEILSKENMRYLSCILMIQSAKIELRTSSVMEMSEGQKLQAEVLTLGDTGSPEMQP